MKFKKKADGPGQMSREEAAEWLGKNLKMIKRNIKTKQGIYPLDPKATFKTFIAEISEEDFKAIRQHPRQGSLETYLKEQIKNFMINRAYFHLEQEDFFQKTVTKLLKDMGSSLFLHSEITAFVTEELEKNLLKRIKKFEERSKFTTFLFTIIRRLIIDYYRRHKEKAPIIRYEPSKTIDRLLKSKYTPEKYIIKPDEKEVKKKIAELVDKKVEELDAKEKVAFKIFYHADVPNYCEIARILGTSRFKAKKITQKAWDKIQNQIRKEITEYFFKSKNRTSN
jgi:RNA polymerase sigma-70 factor (ECF subfamily)